jgi:hypothetical protein
MQLFLTMQAILPVGHQVAEAKGLTDALER